MFSTALLVVDSLCLLYSAVYIGMMMQTRPAIMTGQARTYDWVRELPPNINISYATLSLCSVSRSWVEEVGKKWSCTPSCSKSLVVTLSLFLLCASRHFSPSRLAPTCVLRLWRPRRLRSSCCCYRCCETRHNWKLTSETVESIENCPF